MTNPIANTAAAKLPQSSIEVAKSAITEQAPEQLTERVEQAQKAVTGFSTVLALLQSQREPGKSGQAESDVFASIQSSLLGGLGITGDSGSSVDEQLQNLTSEDSIKKLQSALLLGLQQGLLADKSKEPANTAVQQTVPIASQEAQGKSNSFMQQLETASFGKNGLEVSDGFDVVNILNHLPVVSEMYKNVSGHDVSAISKLAGGYLYGGPTGLAFSAVDLAAKTLFDKSLSGLITDIDYANLFSSEPEQHSQLAQGKAAPAEPLPSPNIKWKHGTR